MLSKVLGISYVSIVNMEIGTLSVYSYLSRPETLLGCAAVTGHAVAFGINDLH